VSNLMARRLLNLGPLLAMQTIVVALLAAVGGARRRVATSSGVTRSRPWRRPGGRGSGADPDVGIRSAPDLESPSGQGAPGGRGTSSRLTVGAKAAPDDVNAGAGTSPNPQRAPCPTDTRALISGMPVTVASADPDALPTPDPIAAARARLSINLGAEPAHALRELMIRRNISATEAIRRALSVWKFIEDERSRGTSIALLEGEGKAQVVREVVFHD
jgi:hypothetical protein